jgi:hypothetical protein
MLTSVPIFFLNWRPARLWMWFACFAALIPVTYVTATLAEQVPRAPHFLTGHFDPVLNIRSLVGFSPRALSWFEYVEARSIPGGVIVGAVLVLVCAFGALHTTANLPRRTGAEAKNPWAAGLVSTVARCCLLRSPDWLSKREWRGDTASAFRLGLCGPSGLVLRFSGARRPGLFSTEEIDRVGCSVLAVRVFSHF